MSTPTTGVTEQAESAFDPVTIEQIRAFAEHPLVHAFSGQLLKEAAAVREMVRQMLDLTQPESTAFVNAILAVSLATTLNGPSLDAPLSEFIGPKATEELTLTAKFLRDRGREFSSSEEMLDELERVLDSSATA